MDKYPGTLLEQAETLDERRKVSLDLLKKINETNDLAFQKGDLESSWPSVLAAPVRSAIDVRGIKKGMGITYASADVLSVGYGIIEVNGKIVELSNNFAINSSMANFPSAGAWAYVTIDEDAQIVLFPATGPGTSRPTDNCFAYTGGGIGYDDLKKYAFYYGARRIVGCTYKVSATSWYVINSGPCEYERGGTLVGNYEINDGWLEQHGYSSVSVICSSAYGNIFRDLTSRLITNLPIAYTDLGYYVYTQNDGGGIGGWWVFSRALSALSGVAWNGSSAGPFAMNCFWRTLGKFR
jgi:hypothetical protein